MTAKRAVLGLDVGGANLKAAHTAGPCASRPFPLWRAPGRLADELRELLAPFPPREEVALTMTGELCDCFAGKADGVAAIIDSVAAVADGRLVVWTNEGRFLPPDEARAAWRQVASANWLALATFAGRFAPAGPALLIDAGTTTTDVVPLKDGAPTPRGRTDPVRLMAGELIYRGWCRTPLMALADERGAAELFATTLDLYLALGLVPEAPDDTDTADGRPATKECAARRIARMWCAEPDELDVTAAACYLGGRLEDQVGGAIAEVVAAMPSWPRAVLLSGSGEPLARGALAASGLADDVPVVSLSDRLGPAAAAAGCAVAVAVLASEREG